jgi:hypothetical protein
MYHTPHSPISVREYSSSRDTMSLSGSVHGPSAKPKLAIPNKNVKYMPETCQFGHPLLTPVRTVFSSLGVPALIAQEGLTHKDCRMYARQCMATRSLVGRINKCNGPLFAHIPVRRNMKASNHPKRLVYSCWKADGPSGSCLNITLYRGCFDLLTLSTARLRAARDFPKRLYKSHPWCKCAVRT